MRAKPRPILTACALAGALVLAACGDRSGSDTAQSIDGQAEALPGPEQSGGSITGMSSRPGPGEVPLSGEPPPPVIAEPADQTGHRPMSRSEAGRKAALARWRRPG